MKQKHNNKYIIILLMVLLLITGYIKTDWAEDEDDEDIIIDLMVETERHSKTSKEIEWPGMEDARYINCMLLDSFQRLWVGTDGQGLYCYDPLKTESKWIKYSEKDGLGDEFIYSLEEDKSNRIWVGHLKSGVSVYNGEEWQNYNIVNGPLGERVFDIKMDPKSGKIWIADTRGLSCYDPDSRTWSYLNQADGLLNHQIEVIEFDRQGRIYLGTQYEGLLIGTPDGRGDEYHIIPGLGKLPNTVLGKGIPDICINDVLVSKAGVIYVTTPSGLAISSDQGKEFHFIRGEDWKKRVEGLYKGPEPDESDLPAQLLIQDYSTKLAEDPQGNIWIGSRANGATFFNAKTEKIIQYYQPSGKKARYADFITDFLFHNDSGPIVSTYGKGLHFLCPKESQEEITLSDILKGNQKERKVVEFPKGAREDAVKNLDDFIIKLNRYTSSGLSKRKRDGFWGEDWYTQGDWVGRYGRQHAHLCALNFPSCIDLGLTKKYLTQVRSGPRGYGRGGTYYYIMAAETDDHRAFYSPVHGVRRIGEQNDASWQRDKYPLEFDGPGLGIKVIIKEKGIHRISIYLVNYDAHKGFNRWRDYLLTLYQLKNETDSVETAWTYPALARTRVKNFYGGVYKQFKVTGPGSFMIYMNRNQSYVSKISGVFIDKIESFESQFQQNSLKYLNGMEYVPEIPGTELAFSNINVQKAIKVWEQLGQIKGSAFSERYITYGRILTYRVVLQELEEVKTESVRVQLNQLLKQWRWTIPLWSREDEKEFTEKMSQAWSNRTPEGAEKKFRRAKNQRIRPQ